MLALARFTLKGPYQAAAIVGLLAGLAVLILPITGLTVVSILLAWITNLLAVVFVGLIILTQGSGSGFKVIAGSAFTVSLVSWVALDSPEPVISMVLLQWMPVIILAQTLRSTKSLATTILVGVIIGVVGIAVQYIFWTDLETGWLNQLALSRNDESGLKKEEAEQLANLFRLMMLVAVSSMFLMYMLVVFLARWMQAKLSNTSGFGQEFRALALGKPAAMVALVVVPVGLWLKLGWLISFALIVVIAFMFQGIAIVHFRLANKKQAFPLVVLFYLLLIFALQVVGILTSFVGVIDNWLIFRKKTESSNDSNDTK